MQGLESNLMLSFPSEYVQICESNSSRVYKDRATASEGQVQGSSQMFKYYLYKFLKDFYRDSRELMYCIFWASLV